MKFLHPNNAQTKRVIREDAQAQLSYGRNLHRRGNKTRAADYSNRVADESFVDYPTRHLAKLFLNQLSPQKKRLIYIDPGRGGSESGAVASGVTENKLSLDVSTHLVKGLEKMGYLVVNARMTNKYVDLAPRANEANKVSADLFVSIHHNSGGRGRARGIETFVHYTGPSGFGQETNRNKFKMNDPRISESVHLADAVHSNLIKDTGFYNRGVKGNNFNVLRDTFTPAILVELGFMDNPAELAILRTRAHQIKSARSIAQGIDNYFSGL